MPASAAEVLQEFELESVTTRRVLERVPTDQLAWKPHPKSRSLGQLALHVAMGPGLICWLVEGLTTDCLARRASWNLVVAQSPFAGAVGAELPRDASGRNAPPTSH